jgi:hypothetical protein
MRKSKATKVFEKVAAKNGVAVLEVRQEIETAIVSAK